MRRNFLQEKVLLFKIKKRDAEAYGQVYDLYSPRIYRFIYFKVSNQDEAEDLTSETFLKCWQYLTSENDNEIDNLSAFIYRIARNLVIDFYRERAKVETMNERELLEKIEEKKNSLAEVEKIIDKANIEKHLRLLKDEYREVIELRYIEEFSVGEIAKILDKTRGSVSVLIYRALQTLREVMGEK